jgi:hypothetical protein
MHFKFKQFICFDSKYCKVATDNIIPPTNACICVQFAVYQAKTNFRRPTASICICFKIPLRYQCNFKLLTEDDENLKERLPTQRCFAVHNNDRL